VPAIGTTEVVPFPISFRALPDLLSSSRLGNPRFIIYPEMFGDGRRSR
jgi:hypothetical protein